MIFGLFSYLEFFCLAWVLPSSFVFLFAVRFFASYDGVTSDQLESGAWDRIIIISVIYPIGLIVFYFYIVTPWFSRVLVKKVF